MKFGRLSLIFTLFIGIFYTYTVSGQICNKSQLSANLQNGLVAFYPFCGSANDISGNGNNGTVMGGVSLIPDRFGNPNQAYFFPGNSTSYIECGLSQSLRVSNAITISVWIYLDGGTINPRIISSEPNFCAGYQMSTSGTSNTSRGLGSLIVNNNGAGVGVNYPNITALQWHHVVMTADINGVGNLYVDGALVNTVNGTPIINPTYCSNLNIGRKSYSAFDAFGGKMDDVGIWNRALSKDEVLTLFNSNCIISGFNALQDSTKLCGAIATLDAGAGFSSYSWNTGATTRTISPTTSGFYKVTVTNASGCTASDSTYLSLVNANIVNRDTTICKGSLITLSVDSLSNHPCSPFPYTRQLGAEIFVSVQGNDNTGNGTMGLPYKSISKAISVAANGSIVTVMSGVYKGLLNTNLSLLGKNITIQSFSGPSCTVIDCENQTRAFKLNGGENNVVIRGIKIINGSSQLLSEGTGSAILIDDNSSARIVRCIFENCKSSIVVAIGRAEISGLPSSIDTSIFYGNNTGAIAGSKKSFDVRNTLFKQNNTGANQLVSNGHVANPALGYYNCVFLNNTSSAGGTGPGMIYLGHGKQLDNCIVSNNVSTTSIVYMGTNWTPTLTRVNNCTFYNNVGISSNTSWSDHGGSALNSIFNGLDAIKTISSGSVAVPYTYSCGVLPAGTGNINANPLFVNPSQNNFSLSLGSPCIGTGAAGSNMGAATTFFPNWMFDYSPVNFNVQWSTGATTSSITVSPTQTTTYYVTVSDGITSCID
ncbi:MAG: LamG-like jellyroll fold domain-containing protein, partial [Bacteroidota bacterium]